MHFTIATFSALLAAVAAAALPNPFLNERQLVPVGFGQELQNNDQTNHWVSPKLKLSLSPYHRVTFLAREADRKLKKMKYQR